MVARTAGIVLVVGLLGGLIVYSQVRPIADRVSGIIEADEIRIGSRVGGRVQRVLVEEGDRVEAGQLLIELEPFDLRDQLAEAEASYAARDAELRRLKAGFRAEEIGQAAARFDQLQARLDGLRAGPRQQEIDVARARLAVARSQQRYAADSFARVQASRASNAASPQDLDQAQAVLQAAEGELQARLEELSLLEAGTREEEIREAEARVAEAKFAAELTEKGYRHEDIEAAAASRDAAAAQVSAIKARLEELAIRAPLAGVVESLDVRKGDLAVAGGPVLALVDDSRLWVRAYVPESRLDLVDGLRVEVGVDSAPGERFAATITFISRQAEFTPSNVQTPEERVKQTFRIKATLIEGLDRLRPGMPADVWLSPAGRVP
ncbi:MAG: HlyD family efflux transporter periplasmic adaptor subunit [Pirellulales bacterium]|nr:HlyD family efflux transporter periplasmic adaptor subunit [Pirellulales bacterium]